MLLPYWQATVTLAVTFLQSGNAKWLQVNMHSLARGGEALPANPNGYSIKSSRVWYRAEHNVFPCQEYASDSSSDKLTHSNGSQPGSRCSFIHPCWTQRVALASHPLRERYLFVVVMTCTTHAIAPQFSFICDSQLPSPFDQWLGHSVTSVADK